MNIRMPRYIKPLIACGVFFLIPLQAFSSTFSIYPSSGTFSAGERFITSVVISSDVSMNAASASLTFPKDTLSVESIQKGSVLNFWVTEPSFSNSTGKINFEGVSLSGFQGTNGSVVTIAFRAKKAGTAAVSFESGQILANDGLGTDITKDRRGASYTIIPAVPAPVEPKPKTEIEPMPEIVETPKEDVLEAPLLRFGVEEGLDTIFGESKYAKADAVLYFVSESGSKLFSTETADAEGSFSVPVPASLKSGTYTVTGAMVLDNGRQSEMSEPLIVKVGLIGGAVPFEYATYAALGVAALAALGIGFLLRQSALVSLKHTQELIKQETEKAKDVVHKSFEVLREDIVKQTEEAVPGASNAHSAALQQELTEAEEVIKKEIEEINPDGKKA